MLAWKCNDWCLRPRFYTCKAILGRGQPVLMNFVVNHIPGAGWSIDMLKRSPLPLYHRCQPHPPPPPVLGCYWLRYIMNEWCLRLRFYNCKAILGRGQPGRMRRILLWIMPLPQDLSLDLLTSSPALYHYTTDAPTPTPPFFSPALACCWMRNITVHHHQQSKLRNEHKKCGRG